MSAGKISALPSAHNSHVIVIVLENAEYGEVIGNDTAPYANSLARRYGLATRSYAVAHPSLPNYLALTGGSTHGVSSDCTDCEVSGTSIVDQLEASAISWRAYLEDAPGPCFRGAEAGGYAKKHNPFIYYRAIADSPSRCAKLVGFARLARDLRSGTLPTYAWITPNLCDDGHDCGVAAADRFLARTVPSLLRELGPHGLLLITWDEGTSDSGLLRRRAWWARGEHPRRPRRAQSRTRRSAGRQLRPARHDRGRVAPGAARRRGGRALRAAHGALRARPSPCALVRCLTGAASRLG